MAENSWSELVPEVKLEVDIESGKPNLRKKRDNILENEKILEPARILSNETQVSPFLLTSRKQEILEPERN